MGGATNVCGGVTNTMASIDNLLEIEGVVAAGEFTRGGELVDYGASMDMSEELAATAAQFCASVTMLFDTLGGAFSEMSGMNWTPQDGWMYAGGDFTAPSATTPACSSRPKRLISTSCTRNWSAASNLVPALLAVLAGRVTGRS
jgi:roadblock/LC7 domain-containing protein